MVAVVRSKRSRSVLRRGGRRGTGLLIALLVMVVVSAITVSTFDTLTLQMAALRHSEEYERALYLAAAGANHALAQIENLTGPFSDFSIPATEFPSGSGDTYQATATSGSGAIVVVGSGAAGGFTRKVEITLLP